ncbi:S41 family peptidase [Salinimicrobium xinjiangense]|uniref:S41 family peptidase n=1 Tax=Salinimicrobium xinjiangense TaxID=438596 RepID=UPI0004264364|nr:S41 family peptidase [Salinimicrobium xinjiangense]
MTYYPVENSENGVESDEKEKEEYLKMVLGSSGFGFRKKEILPGNIGYLEIPLFGPLDRVADTLVDAMHKIADTDALILDLRECRGSMDQNTVPFLLGYFFQDPVHLMDFHIRETNFIRQFWSAAWVPGKKYLNKPVYVLTSGRTFSGGEALAFLMQKEQRATIIGNITRGGSHPFQLMRLNNKFGVNVPYSTSVDPVDGSSWEGVGVNPDIFVDTKLALHEAHLLALHDLLKKNSGVERKRLASIFEKQQADKPIFKHLTFKLKAFPDAKMVIVTGSFNSWERESLFMERKGDEWILSTEVSPGRHTYNFIVDGKWILDPANPEIEKGEFENSVVWVK